MDIFAGGLTLLAFLPDIIEEKKWLKPCLKSPQPDGSQKVILIRQEMAEKMKYFQIVDGKTIQKESFS